jgi:microcystin degradation protein MlrC
VIDKYPFLHPDTVLGDAADWKGALTGHALPGGVVTRPAFEELADEIIARLGDLVASTAIHGLWYNIHGAMCVEGMDDVEAELLRRIRRVIGPEVIVSASMDLHGNVSEELAHQTDLITCYRLAPHEDAMDTYERACRNLVGLLTSKTGGLTRPLKAWVPIPILLPGEQTSTRLDPAKSLYAMVPQVEGMPGVLDAAVWVGYAWADEPRNRAVVVVTGWNETAVAAGAKRLAQFFWDSRRGFQFVAPTGSFAQCIDTALASPARPFFISDSGDNPTAGGAGDVTWGLAELLSRPEFHDETGPAVIYASLPGPEAVDKMVHAGVGATVTVTAGAQVDNIHAGPLTMTGRVHAIKHGDRHAITEAVLQVGSVYAILTRLRKPYHHEHDFTDLGLRPRSMDIVIVKIGYLEPELFDMAADWRLGLTPGGVDQDLERLGHRRIHRPMWPFDKSFPVQPDLEPRFIPFSNVPVDAMGK